MNATATSGTVVASASTAAGGRPHGRTAVIVDLENLLHESYKLGSVATAAHLNWFWGALEDRYDITWSIGAGHRRLVNFVLPVAIRSRLRLRVNRIAKNAADDLLICHGANVPASVSRVVLVTGDGDFIPLMIELQARGIEVVLAAAPSKANRQLRVLADAYWPLATWSMLQDTVLAA